MNQANSTGEQINVEFSVSMDVIKCILVLFAITGNVFVIVAHLKDPLKLFQTSSSQFILNIAVVDLIAAILIAIYTFVADKTFQRTQRSVIFFPMSLSFPSFFILSVERFCSVAFPLWHRANVTLRSCRTCVLGIWLFHSAFEAVNLVVVEYTADGEFTTGCIRVVYVLFFFISTQAFYLASCLSLKKQNHQIIARQHSGENNLAATRAIQLRLLNEKQFLNTITIVCLILALTVFPAIIYYKVIYLIWPELMDLHFTGKIILSLLRVNFTVNPLIYLWRLKNYRKTLKTLFRCQG
jgi:hypothetical protein